MQKAGKSTLRWSRRVGRVKPYRFVRDRVIRLAVCGWPLHLYRTEQKGILISEAVRARGVSHRGVEIRDLPCACACTPMLLQENDGLGLFLHNM